MECYMCLQPLTPEISIDSGKFAHCRNNKELCKKRQYERPFSQQEQLAYDTIFDIYQKVHQHCYDIEIGKIPDKTPLQINIPHKYKIYWKSILNTIFDGKYKNGIFIYEKYYKGKYRDGGMGPYLPKMPEKNKFKQTIESLLDDE